MEIQTNHRQAISPKSCPVPPDSILEPLNINGKKYSILPIEVGNNISTEEISVFLSANFPRAVGHLKILEAYYVILPRPVESPGVQLNAKADIINLLTERELQVAQLVATGFSNKEVAKQLNISEWTISTHLRRIYAKLNVCNRAAMVHQCFGQPIG